MLLLEAQGFQESKHPKSPFQGCWSSLNFNDTHPQLLSPPQGLPSSHERLCLSPKLTVTSSPPSCSFLGFFACEPPYPQRTALPLDNRTLSLWGIPSPTLSPCGFWWCQLHPLAPGVLAWPIILFHSRPHQNDWVRDCHMTNLVQWDSILRLVIAERKASFSSNQEDWWKTDARAESWEYQLQEGQDLGIFSSLIYAQHLEHLALCRCAINSIE